MIRKKIAFILPVVILLLSVCVFAAAEGTLTFTEKDGAVSGGFPYTLQMQLTEPAEQDVTVNLTDDSGAAYTLIIPAGSKTGSVQIDTETVTESVRKIFTVSSAEGVSYKSSIQHTMNVRSLPVVSFYSSLNIGSMGKEWRVQVSTSNSGKILPGCDVFELRDSDGTVLASKQWKDPKNDLIFKIDPTEEMLGGHILSVWLGDYCVSNETAFATVWDSSERPVWTPEVKDQYMAVTVDCGWFNEVGEQILDVLDKYDVKATFFLTGCFIREYPDTVDRIVASGHEIGTHTNSHHHQNEIGELTQLREIQVPCKLMEERYGIKPRLFRPPFGEYNYKTLAISRGMGMEIIMWTIDSHDWDKEYRHAPERIVARVTKDVTPGTIVLFHADGWNTPEVLDQVIPYYQEELGLKCVPVGTLLENAGHELPPSADCVYETGGWQR